MSDTNKYFNFLKTIPAKTLASLLNDEELINTAIILSNLAPMLTTKIISYYSVEKQKELVAKMREARTFTSAQIADVEINLKNKILNLKTNTDKDNVNQPRSWNPRVTNELAINDINNKDSRQPQLRNTVGSQKKIDPRSILTMAKQKIAQKPQQKNQIIGKLPPKKNTFSLEDSLPEGRKIDGKAILAAILRESNSQVKKNIANNDPEILAIIDDKMFVFADLNLTTENDLAKIFTVVPINIAAIALEFANDSLQERALSSLSPRRAEDIRDMIKNNITSRHKMEDVEKAQAYVINVARQLQRAGRVLIDPNEKELIR